MARWRGRSMGVVFQFFQLLPTLTLLDNVMLPMDFCNAYAKNERRDKAMQLLEIVGIADNALKRPSACSGGQQQRAAIARALANNPDILVADEPTGNLDSKTANAIFDLFHALASNGKTVLMVTHDADLAGRVSRAVHMADGAIVDETVNATLSNCATSSATSAALVAVTPLEVAKNNDLPAPAETTPTPRSAGFWNRQSLSEDERAQAQVLRAQTARVEAIEAVETEITLVPFRRSYAPASAYSPIAHAIKLQRPQFKQKKPSDFWKKKP